MKSRADDLFPNEDDGFNSGEWRILTIPGLHNSGPGHWQSYWERMSQSFVRVQQRDWETPVCDDWVREIDAVVRDGPADRTLLVAHSLRCVAVAHWSCRFSSRIRGALLVAPSDVDAATFPRGTKGFMPMPLHRMNFPGIMIASSNDPFVSTERAQVLATTWGVELCQFGAIGHINADSDLGRWNDGLIVLGDLMRAVEGNAS